MPTRTHTNIHGGTGGGNIYYDKRFELAWKIAREQDISKEAQNRLRWFDYHSKVGNAALTCRYFGISESCFWKWKKRFGKGGLKGLNDKSKRPRRVRMPEAKHETIKQIEMLRHLFPMYGKEKIYPLLDKKTSVSSIGRIIKRHNMFYRAKKRKRGLGWRWGQRRRIKELVLHGRPGEHVILDTIVLYLSGHVFYIKTLSTTTAPSFPAFSAICNIGAERTL